MATFNIQNPPKDLTMNNFRAISDNYGGLFRSCRFAVQILPIGTNIQKWSSFCQDFTYLCEIAEVPGRGFMNVDVRYYGPSQKLPYQTSYEDISMTFLCRADSLERQFFDDWMWYVNPTNTFDFNYRDEYQSQINIFQFAEFGDENDDPLATYYMTLHNAYPILVNAQPMTWGDAQYQRLVISFTYTHWMRRGYDIAPGYRRDLIPGKSTNATGRRRNEQ